MLTPNEIAAMERREAKRHTCAKAYKMTVLVRPTMTKHQVIIVDVSATGIAFLIDEPLESGTVVALQRQLMLPNKSWIRSGKVSHAKRKGDQWLIGCVLTPPFSEDELKNLE
jgi:PilZ domain